MSDDLLFVSCDLVAHSAEPDAATLVARVQALNMVVAEALRASHGSSRWLSAGDGGYIAFDGPHAPAHALDLARALRVWSIQSRVPLRVAVSTGQAQVFSGADGRTDMVGPGLTRAARLLQQAASADRVVVTDTLRLRCESAADPDWRFHDPRSVALPSLAAETVWLLSDVKQFTSRWTGELLQPRDDRAELRTALARKDGLTVLYWAKRLLQMNGADAEAIGGVRDYMGGGAGRLSSSSILAQLFADVGVGYEFIRAAVLIERHRGDVICRAGDEGRTMFLVLRGKIAGYLPSRVDWADGVPDFEVGAGELLGEMAFTLNAPRAATLRCAEDSSMLAFSQQEMLAAAAESGHLSQVTHVVNSVVRGRLVQNMCRTAVYLSGADRTGPLGQIERPWVDLNPFCRTLHMQWQQREVRLDTPEFRDLGLYLLAGGRVETSSGVLLQPDSKAPPILVADLPGYVRYRPASYRLLDTVTILFIGAKGFEQFGPSVHRQLAAAISTRTGSSTQSPPRATAVEGLLRVGGENGTQGVDVIFVHGLDGDARSTWHPKENPETFWPSWLAEDVPGISVWSLGYLVNSSAWKGSAMPLADRATNALATLETQGLGNKPIVFICHSLGGLLVKQMLRHALDYGVPAWSSIVQQTQGIVFLSTPHSGSDISSWMKYLGTVLRLTVSVEELHAHDSRLRELNTWFRNSPLVGNIIVQVYCEKQSVAGLLVVNESSADPGLKGVIPIPLDENHVTICKPESREKLIYSRVKRLVAQIAPPRI
jgi:hypothetical protein